MCGIAGIFHTSGHAPVARENVEAMTASMIHRGPDDHGIEILGPIGLGFRRLAILDLSSRGHQPMCFRDGRLWIVFNGEIYNFRELRTELEQKGHRFQSQTDTEVILKAYGEYGESCFERFWGMFAIALWDADTRTLLLARDRFGKKPLYYSHQNGRFAFASELKALGGLPFVSRDPDMQAIDEYFAYRYVHAPRSIFQKVRKVRPGHVLVVHDDSVQERPYWSLCIPSHPAPIRREEALEHLKTLLTDAVRRRMFSDVPVGAFLSGGIDSSLVVALMAEQSPGRVKTFSIGFGASDYDETPFVRQVVERFGTDHSEVRFSLSNVLVEKVLSDLDEPFGDVSALPTAVLSELAHHEVKVALSGDGGDEVFGGYDVYEEMMHRADDKMPGPLGAISRAVGHLLPPELRGARRFRTWGIPDMDELYLERTSIFDGPLRHKLLSKDAQHLLGNHKAEDAKRNLLKQVKEAPLLRRLQFADMFHYLSDGILVKVDRMSMRHSLEVRSPLLDHRVVEFAFGLPEEWVVRDGDRKYLLKELLRQYFPPTFINRRKQGFAVPLCGWFRGSLGALFEQYVLHGRMGKTGWFNMAFVEKLYRAHRAGHRDVADFLWSFLAFGVWCEHSGA